MDNTKDNAREAGFEGSGPNEGGGAWTTQNEGQASQGGEPEGSVLAGTDPGAASGGNYSGMSGSAAHGRVPGSGSMSSESGATNEDSGPLPQVERGEMQLQNEGGSMMGGQSYTVEDGDTLQTLAARFYGSAMEWERILEANSDKLSESGALYPGQELVIPAGSQQQ